MTLLRKFTYVRETLKYFADQCLEFSIDTLNDFGILMFRIRTVNMRNHDIRKHSQNKYIFIVEIPPYQDFKYAKFIHPFFWGECLNFIMRVIISRAYPVICCH